MQNYYKIDIHDTLPADSWHIQDLWIPHLYNSPGYLQVYRIQLKFNLVNSYIQNQNKKMQMIINYVLMKLPFLFYFYFACAFNVRQIDFMRPTVYSLLEPPPNLTPPHFPSPKRVS